MDDKVGCVPRLDAWFELDLGDKTVISGRINNHPRYPKNARIRTSSVQEYTSEGAKTYVKTKNSKYELGQRQDVPMFGDSQVIRAQKNETIF